MESNRSAMEPDEPALQPVGCIAHFLGVAHADGPWSCSKKKSRPTGGPSKKPGRRFRLRARISVSHFFFIRCRAEMQEQNANDRDVSYAGPRDARGARLNPR